MAFCSQIFKGPEIALEAFDERPVVYDPTEIGRAGVFVSIDSDGDLRIERGYVRPEDEPPVEAVEGGDADSPAASEPKETTQHAVITIGAGPAEPESEAEEDNAAKPLSERLITELTTHRTLGLVMTRRTSYAGHCSAPELPQRPPLLECDLRDWPWWRHTSAQPPLAAIVRTLRRVPARREDLL